MTRSPSARTARPALGRSHRTPLACLAGRWWSNGAAPAGNNRLLEVDVDVARGSPHDDMRVQDAEQGAFYVSRVEGEPCRSCDVWNVRVREPRATAGRPPKSPLPTRRAATRREAEVVAQRSGATGWHWRCTWSGATSAITRATFAACTKFPARARRRRRTRAGRGPARLLDVAGGHGPFAMAMCRRHVGPRATVIDLSPSEAAGGAGSWRRTSPPTLADARISEGDASTGEQREQTHHQPGIREAGPKLSARREQSHHLSGLSPTGALGSTP